MSSLLSWLFILDGIARPCSIRRGIDDTTGEGVLPTASAAASAAATVAESAAAVLLAVLSVESACVRSPLLHSTGTDDATREKVADRVGGAGRSGSCAIGGVSGRVGGNGISAAESPVVILVKASSVATARTLPFTL